MDKIISKFRKNAYEEVQVSLREYQGRQLVDIRIYAGARGQDTVPTKKGISLPIELFAELRRAIDTTEELLDEI